MSLPPLDLISRLAEEEFLRRGIRIFDVPAKQLFDHDQRGALRPHPDAEGNRRRLAKLALEFEGCNYGTSGVSLSRSMAMEDGFSLLYSAGCRMALAVTVEDGVRARVVALALYMSRTPGALEVPVRRALQESLATPLPPKGLFLELICAEPHSGGATFLLLWMLKKLSKTSSGIVTHAVNKGSKALLEKHQYDLPTSRRDVFYLDRSKALASIATYEALLRTAHLTKELCIRKGVTARTAGKTYWDC
jgi:hypothetical protein